jgi:CRP/FNR family cyclic AMP-dependent transcriptional regulator
MKLTHLGLTRNQFQVLQYSQLFHGLSDEELHIAANHWHVKKHTDPAVLLLEGHSGDSVFMILEGRAKIYCTDSGGREMAIGYKGSGELLGEMGFIDGTARSATVETMTPTTLLWTDRVAFQECCKETPIIFENLFKIITMQLRLTNARMQILLASGAPCRVARLLVQMAQQTENNNTAILPFKLTQSDIGGMTGLSRASVNAVLTGWRQRGIISIDARHIIRINDYAALKRDAQ